MRSSNLPATSDSVSDFLLKRDAPKIGGSVGGFIALVVCLVAIIILASAAVFYLVREEVNEDEEGGRRRSQYQHQRSLQPISEYTSPSDTSRPSWITRLGGKFKGTNLKDSARSFPTGTKGGGGSKKGWIQTGSGDYWDPPSPSSRNCPPSDEEFEGSDHISPMHECPSPAKSSRKSSRTSHNSSVRFDLRGMTSNRENFGPSPQSSPISSGTFSPLPVHTSSPEPILPPSPPGQGESHSYISPQSAIIIRTFGGGTKFIENLE